MKKLLLPLLILTLLQTSSRAQNQHLVSYQLLQHYTVAEINTILNGFSIPPSLIAAEHEVDYYKVTYITTNALGTDTTIASGAIVVPSNITCPTAILSYQHGTAAYRYEVPSARGGSEYKIGIIGASASGTVVAMPDYLGLGDNMGMHPYINARTEASASIDLLRACREMKDSVGYNLNDQLFLFGYSQGGHAAMATFKEIETNLSTEFTVTAAAPMSGPYNVSGIQAQTIIADTPYATPGYLPYVIMGQQAAYGNVYNNLSEIFKAPYDSLLPIYFDGTHGMGWINNRLPDTPHAILDSAYFHNFKNDPNHFGWNMLRDNDLHNWKPTAPLTMYYCTQDEQVFYQNSLIAKDTMLALGATNIYTHNLGGFNHSDCAPLAFLYGFSFFDLYLDKTGGMTVSENIADASDASTADGSISINISNGTGPYSYLWNTGDTIANLANIIAGNYDLTVIDDRGCQSEISPTVGVASSIGEINVQNYFKVLPNPVQDKFFVQIKTIFEEEFTISIMNLQGQLVYQTPSTSLTLIPFDVSDMPNGIYLVRLDHKNESYTQQLIINR